MILVVIFLILVIAAGMSSSKDKIEQEEKLAGEEKKDLYFKKVAETDLDINTEEGFKQLVDIGKKLGWYFTESGTYTLLYEKSKKYYANKLYKKCQNEKIYNLNSRANMAKAELIAKSIGLENITENNIKMLFQEGLKQFKIELEKEEEKKRKIEEEKQRERLNKLSSKDASLAKETEKYKDLIGNEKTVRMLTDESKELKANVDERKKTVESVKRNNPLNMSASAMTKEKNWAAIGGAVEGLAGPAAALATVNEIQRKNSEIRSQNKELAKDLASLAVKALPYWQKMLKEAEEELQKAENELARHEEEIEKAKYLIFEKLPAEDLLERLKPEVLFDWKRTEAGSLKFNVKLQATQNLIIFDEVPAVVDGTIKIIISLNTHDNIIGTAYLSLDKYGATKSKAYETISVDISKYSFGSYSNLIFTFEPYNLWAVQKK